SELIDLKEIVFHRPDYSFPSDHAMFVASVATMFWLYGYKKLSYWTGGIGILIVIMRVVVAVHYPLDIVAGLILGSLISWALFKNRCFMEKYIVIPIEKIIFRLIKH
ncbi:phosphatase PAP2 family protein, partial [Candidatus Berkelbacteria bacterium]|nr:phosphatase PAP2 family protein [Candidatus Berkelbacteria bacterium]